MRVIVTRNTFWKRHAHRLPRPWRYYASCHGDLRYCYWHPRLRDAAVCRLRGHRWYEVWRDKPDVMCERCAIGPFDPDDLEAEGLVGSAT